MMTKTVEEVWIESEAEWRDLTAIDAFLRLFGHGLAVSCSGKHEIMIHRLDPPATVATYTWEYFARNGAAARREFGREVLRLVGWPDVG